MNEKSLTFRIIALLILMAFLWIMGCTPRYSRHVVPISQMKLAEEIREDRLFLIFLDTGSEELIYIREIDYPYVIVRGGVFLREMKVDLRKVRRIEFRQEDTGKFFFYRYGRWILYIVPGMALLALILSG